MRTQLRTAIVSAFLIGLASQPAMAQSLSGTARVQVEPMLSLWLEHGDVDFGTQSTPGQIVSSDVTYIYVLSNVSYQYMFGTDDEFMTAGRPENAGVKPTSDLELCMLGDCENGTVMPTPRPHFTVPFTFAPNFNPEIPFAAFGYRLRINPDDPPDTYVTSITVTVFPA